jgi:hypothetical protein
MSPAITSTSGVAASLPGLGRSAARALAICTLLLVGLALSTAAHAAAPCPDGARCGKVTVPLDRSNPSAGTVDIATTEVTPAAVRYLARGTYSIAKARSMLGYQPSVDLDEGIRRCEEWLRAEGLLGHG